MVAFVASTVLTAANLNSAFNALTIRTVTGTSDTLVLADNGGAVTYSNASATTSTIPPNSSVAYAVGTKIILANLGAGVVTVTAGVGVTVNGTLTISQNAGGTCIKTATNTWSFLPFGSGAPTLTSADVTSTTGSPTITTSGANTIYSFTGSGTIVLGKTGLADVLVVGGGGGGGAPTGDGGGGAGGNLPITAYLVSGTNTVTVAGGGAVGAAGGTSRLGNYYVPGGGAGAYDTLVGLNGASGGGAGNGSTGGTGVTGIGNNGGGGGIDANNSGGGGGGSSAVGVSVTSNAGGAGGAGTASSITGSSVTKSGGGGGGSRYTAGAGGAGGGGTGSQNLTNATAGSANSGGGGGGANNNGGTSAAGGSGIVIISVVT